MFDDFKIKLDYGKANINKTDEEIEEEKEAEMKFLKDKYDKIKNV